MYAQAPASLLEALEQHLASLEGKKGTGAAPTSAAKWVLLICHLVVTSYGGRYACKYGSDFKT